MTKILAGLAALVVAAGAALFVWTAPPAAKTSTAAGGAASAPAFDHNGPRYRGLAIQVASGFYKPMATYGPMLEQIADLGANAVLFCVPGYMEHARSQSIYLDVRKVPPPEDFKAIIRRGRELGLKSFIMPIVLLRNPRGSEWRGVIDPPDWDDWWEQYTEFVTYFADIARESEAEGLMVGSELVSTEKYTAKWHAVIAKAREHFYGGKLGYSANWDHYRPIEFWDKLDFIGMTTYNTLAEKPNPTVDELIAKWQPIKRDILAWQNGVGKPIIMTEVGWCSQEGAASAPWNYYQNQNATPEGLEEQRRLYEAYLRVWADTPELLGVIWWEWDMSEGGATDFNYTPKNKPAETLLRAWLKAGHPRTATSSAEQSGP